jgi:AraC-like DNA-binding protein
MGLVFTAMKKAIPIHEFHEEDTKNVPVRYVQLNTLNEYDFSQPHRHNYYEVFFFTKGGGSHFIDFVNYPVANNSVHIVYPGQVHVLNREKESFGAVVHFSPDVYGATASNNTQLPLVQFLNSNTFLHIENTPTEQAELNGILEQLKTEYNATKPEGEIVKSYLHILLIKCIRLLDAKHENWQEHASGLYNDFRVLAESHFIEQKQPAYYADKLKISERKLNEICKKATGFTVGDYINNRVILEAKRLLCNSHLTAKEVAFYLGFNDPSYFNRFFKIKTGLTALEFRQSAS